MSMWQDTEHPSSRAAQDGAPRRIRPAALSRHLCRDLRGMAYLRVPDRGLRENLRHETMAEMDA